MLYGSLPFPYGIILIATTVLHHPKLRLYNPPPTNVTRPSLSTPLPQLPQLPPCRPNSPHLFDPSPISRHHPSRLQVPHRRLRKLSCRAFLRPHLFRQIIRLPPGSPTLAFSIPWILSLCKRGLDSWIYVAERCLAWGGDAVENSRLDGGY